MTEPKVQSEPTGLERFGNLEDKIHKLVEAFKTVRKENEGLKADNSKLKGEVESLRESQAASVQTLSQMQKEREELRQRVEKALDLLNTLER